MSREDKITILSKRAPKRIFIGSKYSLNIAQDPTYTSIWKYLSRNISDHKRNNILSNVPGGQKWESPSMCLLTSGKLDIKSHQDQNHRSPRPAHRVLQHKLHVSSLLSRIPSLVPRLHHWGYFTALTQAHDVKCATLGRQAPTFAFFTQPYLTVPQKLDWIRKCLRFRHVWYFVLPGHFRNGHWLEKCEKYTGNNLWPY